MTAVRKLLKESLVLIAAVAAAASAAAAVVEEEAVAPTSVADDDDIVRGDFYSVLSYCPSDDDAQRSPLDSIIKFWSEITPIWSPLSYIGVLLAILGLLVPLLCTVVGSCFCAHYLKENMVELYLSCWGQQVQGELTKVTVQHWTEAHCQVKVRYKVQCHWYKKQFLIRSTNKAPADRVQLVVCTKYPTLCRIHEDSFRLKHVVKILGLVLLSCIVGGLLLTMLIEIAPPSCPYKSLLWAGYAVLFIINAGYLLYLDINSFSGHSSRSRRDGGIGIGDGGYEFIPDIPHPCTTSILENQPQTAIPVAEPISNVSIPSTIASPIRSIFGHSPHYYSIASTSTTSLRGDDIPSAVATFVDDS